jgi:hypothetical protein
MAFISPQTGSIIGGAGDAGNLPGNRTGTALSTNIVIRVGPNAVGAIQSIEIREERSVTPVDELGTDGHIDSAPTSSTKVSGSCRRIRYDRLRVAEAFSRGFLHAKSQRIPFDIDIYDKWNGDDENMIVTTIKNVWITGIDYTYAADNWIITDNMSWMAEDISSSIQGGLAATGGSRGLILQTDTDGIEAQTDVGKRRGALDAPGLINAVFGSS